LTAYLGPEQVARDSYSRAVFKRASLTASHPDIIGAGRSVDRHDARVRVDMNERRPDIAQPAQRVERDRSRMAQDHEPIKAWFCATKATEPPHAIGAIFDNEMTALDRHANAVA
jgi:hypothetical protein